MTKWSRNLKLCQTLPHIRVYSYHMLCGNFFTNSLPAFIGENFITPNLCPLLMFDCVQDMTTFTTLGTCPGVGACSGHYCKCTSLLARVYGIRMQKPVYLYACMHACMLHACMPVCLHACMHGMPVCLHVCLHACMHGMPVCLYACVHACMPVCLYACMPVCLYACLV